MMKNMKRMIATGLSVLTASAFVLGAQGCKEEEKKVVNNHYHSVKQTDDFFMQNGTTEYKLLLPEKADENIKFAAQDFNYFFKLSTGVQLPIVYDNKADITSGKYISVGQTKLLEKSGVKVDESLTDSGFIVKSVEDDILVSGYSTISSVYGMQELLSYLIDWEYFGTDCYRYDKNVTKIRLQEYDVREVADIEYRWTNYGYLVKEDNAYLRKDTSMLKRARLDYMYNNLAGPKSSYGVPQIGHNNLYYIPKDKYLETHPDWYTGDGMNISYVANGNKEEYKLLVEHVAKEMCTILREQTESVIMCTIEDSPSFDASEAQGAITEKYNGAPVASIILFLNDVNKEIKKWLASDEGKAYEKDYSIMFLAYQKTEKAPAYVDEKTGKVTLIDGLKCDPEVVVQYAPIYQDFTHSIYAEENKYYLNNLRAWAAVCENLKVWHYQMNAGCLVAFYDNFDAIADGIISCADAGAKYIYHEHAGTGNAPGSGWDNLKLYLEMKLGWNSSLDVNKLVKEFFEEYYGDASETMYSLFISNRAWTKYLKDNVLGYDGAMSTCNAIATATYWPKNILLDWLDTANQAEEAIAPLKETDPEAYQLYYNHIATERLSYYYLLIVCYEQELSPETILEYKTKFKEDNTKIGGARSIMNGGKQVEVELYPGWGI